MLQHFFFCPTHMHTSYTPYAQSSIKHHKHLSGIIQKQISHNLHTLHKPRAKYNPLLALLYFIEILSRKFAKFSPIMVWGTT